MSKKKSINEIFNNLNKISANGTYITPRRRKPYFELSTHEKNELIKKLKNHIRSSKEINQLLLDHYVCLKLANEDLKFNLQTNLSQKHLVRL